MKFTIPGDPVAQGRGRAVRVGASIRIVDPPKSRAYKKAVAMIAKVAMAGKPPMEGPVRLRITAYRRCPKGDERKREPYREGPWYTLPDWDNLGKAISDALNGICYADDGQVCDGAVVKRTAAQGEPARVEVEVSPEEGR